MLDLLLNLTYLSDFANDKIITGQDNGYESGTARRCGKKRS
jgi:hypothetical protein